MLTVLHPATSKLHNTMASKSQPILAQPSKPTLWYFNGRGLGEPIRFVLAATGIDYQERYVTSETLKELRAKELLAFQQVPLLQVDKLNLVQSMSIARYLARKYMLYGSEKSNVMATSVDMVADSAHDLYRGFTRVVFLPAGEARDGWVSQLTGLVKTRYLPAFEKVLNDNDANKESGAEDEIFLVGSKLTYADCLLLCALEEVVEMLGEEVLQEVPLVKRLRVQLLARECFVRFFATHRKPPADEAYVQAVNACRG